MLILFAAVLYSLSPPSGHSSRASTCLSQTSFPMGVSIHDEKKCQRPFAGPSRTYPPGKTLARVKFSLHGGICASPHGLAASLPNPILPPEVVALGDVVYGDGSFGTYPHAHTDYGVRHYFGAPVVSLLFYICSLFAKFASHLPSPHQPFTL